MNLRNVGDSMFLQCGRIYKDAEIATYGQSRTRDHSRLQCGRIYKDAEISPVSRRPVLAIFAFNVAASIKMRKLLDCVSSRLSSMCLQCGRIYKDAEIPVPLMRLASRS